MKLDDVLANLESHQEFADWKKKNSSCYLAHAFLMMDKANENTWQVGYYNPKTDMMTTFILEGDKLQISPEMNIFKRPGCTVDALDPKKVKIGSVQAIECAEQVVSENYPKISPIKMFFIIQNVKDEGHIYNVTFITQDFQAANIRISTETGKVLCHKIEKILDFKK